MRKSNMILAAAAIAAAASGAWAQTITTLVKEGDLVTDVGNVTLINMVTVNNAGQWAVEADTNNADTNIDEVVLKNGSVFFREGQVLADPPGSSLNSFDDHNLNNNGDWGGNLFLAGTGSTNNDSGVYFNSNLSMQESRVSTAPQFSANTVYVGFFGAKLDDSNRHWIMASVDDPAIATTVDRAIVRADLNPSGQVLSETVIAKEGDVLPGHDQAVADFGTGPHDWAINNVGSVMFVVDGAGDTLTDFAVYLNNTQLAREGSASPVAGRNWSSLASTVVDVNDSGGYVYTGSLDGDAASNVIIIKNGAKFRQEGDTLPAIGGTFTFTSFGTGPVQIDNAGNVVWFGDWNDPNLDIDTGLFYNDQLLVQEGVTTIDGVIVDTIASGQDAFQLSDNGAFLIFEATLVGGIDGAFMVAIPEPATLGLASIGALGLLRRRRGA
jgi:hypothetical protein